MGFGSPLSSDGLNLVPVKASDVVKAPFGPFSQSNAVSKPNGTSQSSGGLTGLQSGNQTPSRSQTRGLQAPFDATPRKQTTTALRSNRLQAPYGAESGEEGFLDIMKGALRIGAPLVGGVLKTGLPMALGPLGGPIGALAGFALNAAGKLAESTDAESFDPSSAHEGTMERAVLAEAALTAIQTMQLHPDDQESIFSDMKDYVMKAAPTIKKVAPKVMGAMMEPALRMALNSLHNYNQKGMSGAEAFEDQSNEPFRPNIQYSARIDQPGDRNTEAFVKGLQNAMLQGQEALDDESEEGFFDFISAGARLASQGLMGAARVGLPILAKMVEGGAESVEATDSAQSALSSSDLAKRALVGEAALQAIMKLPPQTLQEEGFFDFVADAVKKIAPVVVKVAPAVISNLSPTIGSLIKSATGQEAAFVTATAGTRSLSSKRSASMLHQGAAAGGNDFLSKVQGWDAGRGY